MNQARTRRRAREGEGRGGVREITGKVLTELEPRRRTGMIA